METPLFLAELLAAQYGEAVAGRIMEGYAARRGVSLRVNRLKAEVSQVREALAQAGIATQTVAWSEDALIVREAREDAIAALPMYERGEIYLQSLSSMLPPVLLGAQPGENVLDMAAAPGGKTTQIAALTGDRALITACEKNKIRADRLRYNVARQGASHVTVMNTDACRLDDLFSFDRILLDAPCSGSGTVQLGSPRSKGQFSREYLNRTTKMQEMLLQKALRLLRPGHEMIYSTCSVLEQENEGVLERVVKRCGGEIVPIDAAALGGVPLLPVRLPGTLCVCPDALYEGFFVAKIRRKK